MRTQGQRKHVIQSAVNTKTDSQAVFLGFNMDIRGPIPDGLSDDQVNGLRDRCFGSQLRRQPRLFYGNGGALER